MLDIFYQVTQYRVPVKCETKLKRNETNRNETKPIETKPNETKPKFKPNETKFHNQNEMKNLFLRVSDYVRYPDF